MFTPTAVGFRYGCTVVVGVARALRSLPAWATPPTAVAASVVARVAAPRATTRRCVCDRVMGAPDKEEPVVRRPSPPSQVAQGARYACYGWLTSERLVTAWVRTA